MASFNDLPNELIVEVWRQVLDPEAVESFALTSKRIYALGRNAIQEHNELKAKFSSIDHCEFDKGNNDPVETLKNLLLNPRAALYVRNVSITRWTKSWGDVDDSEQVDQRSSSEGTMELFGQAIKDNPFILEDEVVSWLDALATGNESAVISLVLTMLPKLHSLNLPHVYLDEILLFDTIKRIAECNDTKPLSRLTEVRLLPGNINGIEGFNWVRTFAKVPSVKAIKAWDIGPDCACFNHDYPNDRCS